ncbi:MAG TPA: acyl-CoA dehydrogenase family protein [Vicinamibacterales bacterium]|jgi:alkylation response protein AidB-like acyl-CoA dehydrogenase|nr:acyl-CoA dehydrogenase family protein [Vicinamibacterales bacterium]
MRGSVQERDLILFTVRTFVDREVVPTASALEHRNEYPAALVARMAEIGLFGINVPEAYGGTALGAGVYAEIFEELARGWMSVAGVLGTHLVICDVIAHHGTDEQKQRFLPLLAAASKRGALALTESEAGSDLKAIRTTAVRDGASYVLNGAKMWITNARYGEIFVVLAKTGPDSLSAFIVEKGAGVRVSRDIDKLGYKGIETCEVLFEDCRVPAANLLGSQEGHGLRHVMTGLEAERINVAARGVGLAQAALEEAVKYARVRKTFGKPIAEHQAIQLLLADMATRVEAARQLTRFAAAKKDRGERCDLEAGMAKLFATETAQAVSLDAMRVLGANGYSTDFPVERFYRDAPLLIIGGGTNEIQRLVIARALLKKYLA